MLALVASPLGVPALTAGLLAIAGALLLTELRLAPASKPSGVLRRHAALLASVALLAVGATLAVQGSPAGAVVFAVAAVVLVAGIGLGRDLDHRALLVAVASASLALLGEALGVVSLIWFAIGGAMVGVVAAGTLTRVVPTGGEARLPESVRLPPVCVFFGEDASRSYQVEQWLPPLERLHSDVEVALVLRHGDVAEHLRSVTSLPCVLADNAARMVDLYQRSDSLQVIIYVNNGTLNFQSLALLGVRHVHVGHGESDKASSATHQMAAYDVLLVAGQAASDRLTSALGMSRTPRIVQVGRPQLDFLDQPGPPPSTLRTCVYAPTWEGEDVSNDASSLVSMGPEIVRQLLQLRQARVVYKPHPRTLMSTTHGVRRAHEEIQRQMRQAAARDPEAGHIVWTGDVLPVLRAADVLVADGSSVPVDHLFVRPDARLVLTRASVDTKAARSSELYRAATAVSARDVGSLAESLSFPEAECVRTERVRLRSYYFCSNSPGESTDSLIHVVLGLLAPPNPR